MKYMGSKAALLRGELGQIVKLAADQADRFVDLFSGSGSVTEYIATRVKIPVLGVDLQQFSQVLVSSVVGRTDPIAYKEGFYDWIAEAKREVCRKPTYLNGAYTIATLTTEAVQSARLLAAQSSLECFITRHYGGHYFSLSQSAALDQLNLTLPRIEPFRTVALAAIIRVASEVAAAPGHTAQPFQPTQKLLPHIKDAWSRDVFERVQTAVDEISAKHALVIGEARAEDAFNVAAELNQGDLVFCDPPYSNVQYSRFYHVLEGIARGGWDRVYGAGRYPAAERRASSGFSLKSRAIESMKQLLRVLYARKCHKVVITFPAGTASNGLSSSEIQSIAIPCWHVELKQVSSTHSTLGGSSTNGGRGGRRALHEAVLTLQPRDPVAISIPDPARD